MGMAEPDERLDEKQIVKKYLLSLLRGRRAVNRILESVANVMERDEHSVRTLIQHPETIAALVRSVDPEPWLRRAARRTPSRRSAAVLPKPFFHKGKVTAPPGRNMNA